MSAKPAPTSARKYTAVLATRTEHPANATHRQRIRDSCDSSGLINRVHMRNTTTPVVTPTTSSAKIHGLPLT